MSDVYQFKITLKDILPLIWRRIQVPENFTFWDLHVAIQDAMGWLDCHLHCFEFVKPGERVGIRIGIPDQEAGDWDDDIFPGWKVKISEWFKKKGDKCCYDYDFGDSWEHAVVLEKILPAEVNIKYPRCIAGKRACPPEDCGGPGGYDDLLKILANSRHPEYKDMQEWLDGPLDPESFDAGKIKFSDSKRRLKVLLKHI